MPKAVRRQTENWTYVLPTDRDLPPGQQSVFTLAPLALHDRAKVRDAFRTTRTYPDGGTELVNNYRRLAVSIAVSHIVSIENFPVGSPQPWPAGLTSERQLERQKYLEQLDDDSVVEIGDEIYRRSTEVDELSNGPSLGDVL